MQDDESSETLPDIAHLDSKIAEAEEAMAKAETSAEKRKAKERKEDLMRLKRVEQIYVCQLSAITAVLFVLNADLFAERSATCAFWLGARFTQATPCHGDSFGGQRTAA